MTRSHSWLIAVALVVAACARQRRADADTPVAMPALATPAFSRTAPAAAPIVIGVGAHELGERDLAALLALGVNDTRYTCYWGNWGDARYRDRFRDEMTRARRAGLHVLVVVHSPPPSLADVPLARLADSLAAFIAARAAEYPGTAWEVLNEMNAAQAWSGAALGAGDASVSQRERGRRYGTLLTVVARAVRRADPSATVVTGGVGGEITDFLEGLYDTGASAFDVVAVHAYGEPLVTEPQDTARWGVGHVIARSREARSVMRERHDTRPLWLTETGIGDVGMRRAWGAASAARLDTLQRDHLRRALERIEADRLYERVYLYQLRDDAEGYGLVRNDYTPRPSYEWLKAWRR